jgi:predicted CoA-binding protein
MCSGLPEAADVTRQAAAGATPVWLQLGITSDEARAISLAAGILHVENRCLVMERRRLGIEAPVKLPRGPVA